ncbi:unnamed protein product [Adineta steineri]|uniref:Uncharacterized protein n=1 Tax=Adineta steineri TaxID=433720 RepID=A0A814YAJ8_9BILA|nr:unnamed protein product [Adineta steineri]CAF1326040.1 unnamed protein product [Adineta steineri]
MAMTSSKTQCFKCKIEKITYPCKGCSKEFCLIHLTEHQQILNEELNQITNDYNEFKPSINKQKEQSHNYSVIKKINQWEINRIERTRQQAQEYRELVIKSSASLTVINDIEMKFNDLSEQIKQIHKENIFNEINLNYLTDQLKKMIQELNNPPNISIAPDSQSQVDEVLLIVSRRIFIDKNKNIFIADLWNHRIVEWKCGAKDGQIIAGGNGKGNGMGQLNEPSDVIVDQKNHSIIIADSENKRVIRWFNQKQQILIQNIDCYGLTMDKHGFLYVSDWKNNEVRRWKMGEYGNDGIVVAGGNGKGYQLNQLYGPTFIVVDENQSIYVSDTYNHRVMKWKKDAKQGIVVAGGNDHGENLSQLFHPRGVVVDHLGQIYVADCMNHRVVRWCEGKSEGEIVVGRNKRRNQLNRSKGPMGLSFDDEGNLYVADFNYHRIESFKIIFITVQIKCQKVCKKTSQYGLCSTNSACGCFHVLGANYNTGICGFRWPACSRLVLCNSSDNSCSQPDTTCVRHPQCNDLPVCYPVTMTNQSICPPMKNNINVKWEQNATTVAGENVSGQQLNQLDRPRAIFIDEKKNIFIADSWNDRIIEWKYNAKEGQIIAGGNGKGNEMDQLNEPSDVVVDQQNHSIIIADYKNSRVVQWVGEKQQILIQNIVCYGLAMDKHGFLYVTNDRKSEVRRWKMGEYNNDGIAVAGENGLGSQLNQLDHPRFIFVDEDQSVYVADVGNHRVMKWKKDAKEGIVVAGGNDKGGNLNQLSSPHGVIVDDLGRIYVADWGNNRVMRWSEGKEEGEIIVGGNGGENHPNQLSQPHGLSFDDEGNLYVADYWNHRIQKFEIIL